MDELTPRELELVAIGAAMGSNCIPCVRYHIGEAKKAGFSDMQILEAIQMARTVKNVPAEGVLKTALGLLEKNESMKEALALIEMTRDDQ